MRIIKRDIVGAFIFSGDEKLLLGKAGVYAGTWAIPGGGIDVGETKLKALIREVLEETGIDITGEDIKQVDGVITGKSEKTLRDTGERVLVDMKFYNYAVQLKSPASKIEIKAEDDFTDVWWAPISELKNLPLTPPSITTLKKLGYLKS